MIILTVMFVTFGGLGMTITYKGRLGAIQIFNQLAYITVQVN